MLINVKGQRAVKNVIETCQECRRKFSSKQAGQMMAPLWLLREMHAVIKSILHTSRHQLIEWQLGEYLKLW